MTLGACPGIVDSQHIEAAEALDRRVDDLPGFPACRTSAVTKHRLRSTSASWRPQVTTRAPASAGRRGL